MSTIRVGDIAVFCNSEFFNFVGFKYRVTEIRYGSFLAGVTIKTTLALPQYQPGDPVSFRMSDVKRAPNFGAWFKEHS